jgi:RNA polymerase sigma factor (sigma-70 family)
MDALALLTTIKTSPNQRERDDAFEQLDKTIISRYINRRLSNKPKNDREDIAQACRLRVYDYIIKYPIPADRKSCEIFIGRWIYHCIGHEYHRNKQCTKRPDTPMQSIHNDDDQDADHHHPASREPDPLDTCLHRDSDQQVRETLALSSLTDREFDCLTDQLFEGLTSAESADKQGITEKAVNNARYKALVKVKSKANPKGIRAATLERETYG